MIETIPLPATDYPPDAPFWSAALRSQLSIQQCAYCQRLRFPPRPMCPHCQSVEHAWVALSGRAKVWSFTMPQPPLLPIFEKMLPYVVVLAEIVEDPSIRIIGNLVSETYESITNVDITNLKIGADLRVRFRSCAIDVALPCWILSEEL